MKKLLKTRNPNEHNMSDANTNTSEPKKNLRVVTTTYIDLTELEGFTVYPSTSTNYSDVEVVTGTQSTKKRKEPETKREDEEKFKYARWTKIITCDFCPKGYCGKKLTDCKCGNIVCDGCFLVHGISCRLCDKKRCSDCIGDFPLLYELCDDEVDSSRDKFLAKYFDEMESYAVEFSKNPASTKIPFNDLKLCKKCEKIEDEKFD